MSRVHTRHRTVTSDQSPTRGGAAWRQLHSASSDTHVDHGHVSRPSRRDHCMEGTAVKYSLRLSSESHMRAIAVPLVTCDLSVPQRPHQLAVCQTTAGGALEVENPVKKY